ncbi:MAG: ABC transporter ATP-binding protein [Hydrogenophilales bacterium RIFOXYD1_FULL_62_11]|nr:MAG: ABC transporter ATP-binding protein [Hydrogenophilales bacterium RIFOXYD1_FULL_62_11]
MNAEIKPLQGFEKLKFGTQIDLVRESLGVAYKTFKRTSSAEMPCDFFESLGIFTYYKTTGVLEAIEFVSPARPFYGGVSLLEAGVDEIIKTLMEHDSDIEETNDGLTSYKLGIGIYAPDADENPNLPPESVIAFAKDYYD